MKFGPVVQKEMSFKEKSLPTDGRRTKTDHNSSPWAFGSGELKREIPAFLFQQGLHTRMLFFFCKQGCYHKWTSHLQIQRGRGQGFRRTPPPEKSQVAISFLRKKMIFVWASVIYVVRRCWPPPPPLTEFSRSVHASAWHKYARIQRGWTGGPGPLWKITKIYGFLAILVRAPWNSQNSQSYQASI